MAKKHDPKLDDPSKIQLCGYNALDLIKVAGLMREGQSWQMNGQILFKEMQPVIRALTEEDDKRLKARKAFSVSDIARNITDRQTQRLRILHQIFGWALYEMSMESDFIKDLATRIQGNIKERIL